MFIYNIVINTKNIVMSSGIIDVAMSGLETIGRIKAYTTSGLSGFICLIIAMISSYFLYQDFAGSFVETTGTIIKISNDDDSIRKIKVKYVDQSGVEETRTFKLSDISKYVVNSPITLYRNTNDDDLPENMLLEKKSDNNYISKIFFGIGSIGSLSALSNIYFTYKFDTYAKLQGVSILI